MRGREPRAAFRDDVFDIQFHALTPSKLITGNLQGRFQRLAIAIGTHEVDSGVAIVVSQCELELFGQGLTGVVLRRTLTSHGLPVDVTRSRDGG